ncbi:asparaginase [Limimonas halophila]|nr:asparaginase [Limimonas halophila]
MPAPERDSASAPNPVCVEVTRGARVESRHRAAVAVVDTDGRVVLRAGAVEAPVYPRSAIKPLQALPLVESGAAEALDVGDAELAVACGSHAGAREHVETVEGWLHRLGLGGGDLVCNAAAPPLERLRDNCSGKHAGFLALARHLGAPTAGYAAFEHPVQQRVLGVLEQMTGLGDLTAHARATDGCGVPTIAFPLGNLALAMARLGDPDDQPDRRIAACARIRRAMAAHPAMVAGRGRAVTRVLDRLGEGAIVKGGAEGVMAGCCPDLGLGFAVKVDDGAARAANAIALALLDRLQRLTDADREALTDLLEPPVTTRAGERVGTIRCTAPWDG